MGCTLVQLPGTWDPAIFLFLLLMLALPPIARRLRRRAPRATPPGGS